MCESCMYVTYVPSMCTYIIHECVKSVNQSTSQPVCQYYIHVCTPQGTPQGTGGYLSLYTFLQCVESVFSLPLHIVHFTRQTFNILLASGHTSERILSAARVVHCVYTWHSKYSSKYSFRVLSDTCFRMFHWFGLPCCN